MKIKNNSPTVSVIIPVYNDAEGLSDTLSSLVIQDYENYEIIVADNGSSDDTLEIAKNFQEKYPDIVKIVIEDKIQSSYAARNKGILSSNGETIAFIDADMIVEKNWLSKVVKKIEEGEIDYMGCNVEIFSEKEDIFSLYNKITEFHIEEDIKELHFSPTCCLVVRRRVFEEVELFDSRLISSGDLEFGNRVHNSEKYKMEYASNITMKHPARSSVKSLVKKMFRIGRGNKQLTLYFPKTFSYNFFVIRHLLPPKTSSFLKKISKTKNINNISFLNKLSFFFIMWLLKIATGMGYLYESIKK